MAHADRLRSPTASSKKAKLPRRISQLADHLFRQEAGKLVSILTGIFGIARLQMAEDVVQEALVRALRTWPYSRHPEKSVGLAHADNGLAVDLLRREKLFFEKQPEIITFIEQRLPGASLTNEPMLEEEIKDDRLPVDVCLPTRFSHGGADRAGVESAFAPSAQGKSPRRF